jgi:DivIVA domain-containing protein
VILVGTAFYIGLLTSRKVSPPAVPVATGDRLPGHATGEAALVRRLDSVLAVGDAIAFRGHGHVRLGFVQQVGAAEDGGRRFVLSGTGEKNLTVSDREVVGRVDQWVPALGWLLLIARERLSQLLFGAAVVALLLALITGRGLDLIDDEDEDDPLLALGAPPPLALPAGPPVFRHQEAEAEVPAPSPVADPAMPYRVAPMAITPEDLRQVRFTQTRRGYDTEAVDRALDTVADALDQLHVERQQLVDRVQVLEAEVNRYKALEVKMNETVAQASAVVATPLAAVAGVPEGALVEMLGELRGIRALLQTMVGQQQQTRG